jgi:hypothetical protein
MNCPLFGRKQKDFVGHSSIQLRRIEGAYSSPSRQAVKSFLLLPVSGQTCCLCSERRIIGPLNLPSIAIFYDFMTDPDFGEPALANLADHRAARLQHAVTIDDLLTVDFHRALLDHAKALGGALH